MNGYVKGFVHGEITGEVNLTVLSGDVKESKPWAQEPQSCLDAPAPEEPEQTDKPDNTEQPESDSEKGGEPDET